MKEVVFNKPPTLDLKEKHIADLHSIFNILNVLSCELYLLIEKEDAPKSSAIEALINEFRRIAAEMGAFETVESQGIGNLLSTIRVSQNSVIQAVRDYIETLTDKSLLEQARETLSNIESIYEIVHQRLSELEARATDPNIWISISTQEFKRQFVEVFCAIEKNAKGRYSIFFNLAQKNSGDYYIDLTVDTINEKGLLYMPMRLIDVLRDLTANARKYTLPGGRIALAIYQGEKAIQVTVEDSGCGIPDDEIERVVEFGYRASNVRDRPTMGGGLGLTKAAWLINEWGGHLSIASSVNKGTCLRFTVPNQNQTSGLHEMI